LLPKLSQERRSAFPIDWSVNQLEEYRIDPLERARNP
jgi:hypothetical protein